MKQNARAIPRRTFFKTMGQAAAAGAVLGLPQIVPSRVFGARGPAGGE